MRVVKPKVWSGKRKWLGNLIPALVYLPTLASGIALILTTQQILGLGLYLVVAAVPLGLLAVNTFGLYQNEKMRLELARRLQAAGHEVPGDSVFVGFATPGYSSLIDPHEDLGFLYMTADAIHFRGEEHEVRLAKQQISSVSFRPNAHTAMLLGRWISIDGVKSGTRVRLLVEPRKYRTLWRNRRYSKELRRQIEGWAKTANPGPKPGVA